MLACNCRSCLVEGLFKVLGLFSGEEGLLTGCWRVGAGLGEL